MSGLRAEIDSRCGTVTFTGATFQFKDEIKALGAARWDGAAKAWIVHNPLLDKETLSRVFPGIEIEELNAEKEEVFLPESLGDKPESLPPSFSVRELCEGFRAALSAAFPSTIYVRGVLSQVKEQKGGRIFLDLSEPDEPEQCVSCVIWQDGERILKPLHDAGFKLEADLQVMFHAAVSFNSRGARISLRIIGVVAEYTVAKASAKREMTNERLRKEGLFDKNRQLKLTFLPKRLGVLTSSGGTVINDFLAALEKAHFGFELFWANASVQGASAKAELLEALRLLAAVPDLDAVLIFRGGGSAGDLAVFNEYEVAKAVCLCPLPVFSAIGHQEDNSSVQDVSYRSLGVPKDLGRFFAELVKKRRESVYTFVRVILEQSLRSEERARESLRSLAASSAGLCRQMLLRYLDALDSFRRHLPQVCGYELEKSRERVAALQRPLELLSRRTFFRCAGAVADIMRGIEVRLRERLQGQRHKALLASERMMHHGQRLIEREKQRLLLRQSLVRESARVVTDAKYRLESLERFLDSASPRAQLERGFALVRRAGRGDYVKTAAELSDSDAVEIEFVDAKRTARICS